MVLFGNWYFLETFGIPSLLRKELFVQVTSRSSDYKVISLSFSRTAVVFANHCTFEI